MAKTEEVVPMTKTRISAGVLVVALLGSLSGCGGGGDDEAGSPTAFSVQPTTATVTSTSSTACSAGYVGEFFVYGGVAPYRLNNTVPDAMVLDRTTVSDRGGSFQVSFTGICVSPALIVIVDKLDNQIVLTLNNNKGSGT
ncbi:MAG: hypothetical protein V4844_19345 [Pseudomonadota bacterium]